MHDPGSASMDPLFGRISPWACLASYFAHARLSRNGQSKERLVVVTVSQEQRDGAMWRDGQGAFVTPMAVLDLPLALPLPEQRTRRGIVRRAGRLQDIVAVQGFETSQGRRRQVAGYGRLAVHYAAGHAIQVCQMTLLKDH